MYDYHIVLGTLGLIVGIIGYAPYFRDIFRGKTKPHVFTWVVFALLNAIVFFGQIARGAGAGSWVMAITVVGCTTIAIVAFLPISVSFLNLALVVQLLIRRRQCSA